jgi:mono/diheme cytochrome c family protein
LNEAPLSNPGQDPPAAKDLYRPGFFRRYAVACFIVLLGLGGIAFLGAGWLVVHGVSTRDTPTAVEEVAARALRHLAVPAGERRRANPVPPGADVLAEGRAHWADHCATCHGNDGRGETEMGRSLYPKAPDMTLPKTQGLSDGEMFAIIKNGVRLTGMPAWGNPTNEGDAQTWKLVHFIRHLREITPEELDQMKAMNPVSPMEKSMEQDEDDFLKEGKDSSHSNSTSQHGFRPQPSRKENP